MNVSLPFGEPTEIADGIFCIPTDYPAVADAPLWTHLIRGDVATLVDCGVPSTYDAVLAHALPRIGVSAQEIAWLLLTHGHPDHMGGHPGLSPHASFKVAAPLEDAIWIETVERQWHDFWDRFPGTLDVSGIREAQIAMCGGDLPVDLVLRDGDVFEAGGRSLEVVRTRGHTRGHCAYFERATGVLFSGDAVQGHGIPSSSGATVFAPLYDDVDDCLAGLRRLRALPFALLCGAHFAPLERDAGLAVIDDSIAFVHETDAQVRELLAAARGPVATTDIAAAIGQRAGTKPPVTMQTIYTANAHLTHAARAGLAEPRWAARSTDA
ncbi:MAG TPA: MBL fold metallo-hydrolase [Gaiellales bacterium]|jgi:glyoxylase-like metal-dependent hydrolase (beta-lactamase superfamily II)